MKRDREFLIELATLYYEMGLSQQELAKRFSISRPSVSGLLKRCREEGIVEIRIERSPSSLASALEGRLKERYGLAHSAVVPKPASAGDIPAAVGRRSAELTRSLLRDGIRIGLSWGSSLFHTVKHFEKSLFTDITTVQMVGGLGGHNIESDGYALARRFAGKVNGVLKVIQAPILVGNDELKAMLVREPAIKEALGFLSGLNLALVGISSNQPDASSLVREGFITAEESKAIWDSGGVGHICGYHFDARGRFLDIPLNRRIIGIDASEFSRIPETIAVAWGRDKVRPLHGALTGGLVNALVTDEDTALRLLGED